MDYKQYLENIDSLIENSMINKVFLSFFNHLSSYHFLMTRKYIMNKNLMNT